MVSAGPSVALSATAFGLLAFICCFFLLNSNNGLNQLSSTSRAANTHKIAVYSQAKPCLKAAFGNNFSPRASWKSSVPTMRRMAMISQSVALERGETPAGVMLSRPEDWTEHVMVPTDIQALGDIWDHLAEKVPEQVCFTDDYHDGKVEMTYGEAFEVMNNIGSGFQKLGLEKGDKVSLFSDNSYRWLLADNAILRCGAASAVRGSAAPVDELGYILEHSESRGLVVENPDVYEKLSSKFPNLFKNLKFCVFLFPSDDYIPGQEGPEGTPLISYEDLIELGKQKPFEKVDVSKEDLASLIYTSGTTGKPKGVILNHKQFVHQMLYQTIQAKATGFMGTIRRMLKNSNPKPGEIFLSILPSWHIFERVAEYWILSRGGHMVYTNIKQFRNDIQKWKPHYLVAVPRLYETIYQGAEKKFNAKPTTAKLVSFFKGIGNKYLNAKRNLQGFRGQVGPIGKVKSALTVAATSPIIYLSDKLVWSKIRKGLGGRLKVAISGGSALPMYVEDFFELSKVPVIVGYGLTETTAPIANRLVQLNQRGTTGTPTAEVRIVHPETGAVLATGEQGEIQVRGDQVMMGYFKDDLATQKVLNRDGWFSTGDLGVINKKGILKITGRQKDTIVLLNGENIEPQPIEEALVASSVIDQVMLVGQDSNYLSALIVPSLDGLHEAGVIDNSDVKEITELREMNDQEGLATLATEISSRPAMEALILSEINKLNRAREGFRPDDNVRKFQLILSPFSMDNGLLTQTLKVKRKDVAKKYQHLIDAIYQR